MSIPATPADTSGREIRLTRLIDAPRHLVFHAWTDPKLVAKWWGPNGFTTTIREMDVRAGGHWRLVMHGPDGRNYQNHIVFEEVVAPERLVYRHEPEKGTEPVGFRTTVTFAVRQGKTEVTLLMVFASEAELRHVVETYGAVEGGRQTLARLADHLAETHPSFAEPEADREIVITRQMNASRDMVYKAFTSPDYLRHWWGPRGFKTTTESMDLRPGGAWKFVMHGPDGTDYQNHMVFEEVTPRERLVYTHGSHEADPHSFHVTITFVESAGQTTVTLRLLCQTVEERQAKAKFGAIEGGRQTLERWEKAAQQLAAGEPVNVA